jgi:hypothetical protein
MLLRSLLERLVSRAVSRPSPKAKPLPGTWRPAVEALEDRLTPAAMLTISDATVLEGNDGTQNALVTVSLTEPHGNNVNVNYSTVDGTAVAGSDYTAVSGLLTFTKNEMSKSIAIPIRGDRVVESDESFSVRLSNARGAKIADGTGDVRIVDNEPYVWVTYAQVIEGNDGTAPAVFTAYLTALYDRPVTVTFATADGSALAGQDYIAVLGSITIPAGQSSQDITVPVRGDRLGEPNETFVLNVSTADSYARMGNAATTGTIVDNEPHIFITDAYNYGEGTMTFTVTLSAPYDQNVMVHFATMDGTAVAGVDYVAASGTLTFDSALGETTRTITIAVLDPTPAPDKYFRVQLSGATPNSFLATESAYGYWYYDSGYGGGDWGGYWDYYYYYGY